MNTSLSRASRSILTVTLCTAFSRLLGFARLAVIGTFYGAEGSADVLHLVFQIPNNLRRLLAEGSLSSAFIPVLSTTLNKGSITKDAKLLVQTLFGLQCIILIPLLVISTLLSKEITLTLFDFPTAELAYIANWLFKILLWYIFPISMAAIIMAALHSHGYFTLPAITPILFSVTVIGAIVIFHERFGVYAVSGGVLVGGMIQLVIQIPRFIKVGYRFSPRFVFTHPLFRTVMRFWGPVTISSALFFINQQVASYFASGLESGSASAMINALTFWQLPFGLLGISVMTVLYPKMSASHASGNLEQLRETVEYGISYLLVTVVPATLYLLILPHSIIAAALQRGAFTAINTALTARMLFAYSCGLLPVILYQFLLRFYYSCHDYKRPIYAALMVLVIDIALSLWLKETSLRVVGLAYANTVAFSCGLCYLLSGMSRHLQTTPLRTQIIIRRMARVSVALIGPTLLLLFYGYGFGISWKEGGTIRHILIFGLFTLCYICCTLICYRWFRVQPAIRPLLGRR